MKLIRELSGVVVGSLLSAALMTARADVSLLNVSYDPTREVYQDYNAAFAKYWKAKTNETVSINQSHGGRGSRRWPFLTGWVPMW